MLWQPALPDRYRRMTDGELDEAIAARKRQLGPSVVILGHHYQQDEVIRHADFTGDSFKLSQLAAKKVAEVGAKYVVFCGVHFMAESADILTPPPPAPKVAVVLPDLSAGCSMADMASLEDVAEAWEQINGVVGNKGIREIGNKGIRDQGTKWRIVPITYMNSTASIKAFVGERGGAVCTSSNAHAILEWAFSGGAGGGPLREGERVKILFLPDQHLGRNTAASMGYDVTTQMTVWDPRTEEALGGNEPDDILRSDVILWKGHCSVHKLFRPEHVDQIKAQLPGVTVIVHPECEHAVVQKADMTGSTEGIIKAVEDAPAGSSWAIGTEVHLVNRLAKQAAGRGVFVRILSECQCLCTTMYRIDPQHLLWVLDNLADGKVVNQITVDPQTRKWALVSLNRMLEITAKAKPMAAHSATPVVD
ncbi:MAG: quinolinate synthase NadA [Phycisphaerales bacterium]